MKLSDLTATGGNKMAKVVLIFQILLYVTGIVFLILIFRWFYNRFLKPDSETVGTKDYEQTQHDVTLSSGISAEIKGGAKFSYPIAFYDTLAIQLYEKMQSFLSPSLSDMQPIWLKCHNYLDILQLEKSFGIRDFGVFPITHRCNLIEAFDNYAQDAVPIYYREYSRALSEKLSKAKK
jgi:hypothetical protein